MMNRFSKFAIINLFCFTTLPAVADDQYEAQQTAANTGSLVQYLQNLGGFLGYDITKSPTANNNTISQTLLNMTTTQLMETYMFNTFLGAIPVNAVSSALSQFIPSEIANASTLNAWANNVFNTQNFNNPQSQQQGNVSVNTTIDQQSFQQDPVSQSILNILGTPDDSYCMNYNGTSWVGCSQQGSTTLMPSASIMASIIGGLPSTYQYFTYQYNQQIISQLNSNSLTAPMLYSTQSASGNSTSSPGTTTQNNGLVAQNQAQQAANFIRYVSGSVTPLQMPNLKTYDTLYGQATPASPTATPTVQQIQAQATLGKYFTTLRTYAAQNSVGLSNLYFIMAKRLPQNQSASGQTPSSQALSEFNMATWRLFNSDMSANNQWISQINNSSTATVEKEIATLLAEISYQMYLDRQLQERILLTNSIILMQNTRTAQPDATFSSTAASQPSQ